MTGQSEQVGDELRMLLSAVIAAVEPMLGQLSAPGAPASACTWCPVCALVALSRGEQHPLLTAISVHGAALLAILRDVLADAAEAHGTEHPSEDAPPAATESHPADSTATPPADPAARAPAARRRPAFERISVNLDGARS